MKQNVFVKITSSVAISGKIVRPGEIVELGESDAKGLLRRGKAVVATDSDMPQKELQNGDGYELQKAAEETAAAEEVKAKATEAATTEADKRKPGVKK